MKIVRFAIDHPVTVVMVSLAAMLFGAVALSRLPVNLLPDITYPTLTIETELPDAAPEEVEKLVTEPIEEAVGVVSGIGRIHSRSSPGLSQITLEFAWDSDMDYASLDVREKVDMIDLPDEAGAPVLLRFDPTLDPIMRIGVYGRPYGSDNLVALREVADREIKKELESLEGVAAVRLSGGLEEEIHVDVDGPRLAALGQGIAQVGEALRRQNVNISGGRLRDRESEFLVRALNEFRELDDISSTVLAEEAGRVLRVGDVATVERGFREREILTRIEGEESVEIAVYKEGDANTVTVARQVRDVLEWIREEKLPPGVEARVLFDQSTYIAGSVREVRNNTLIGGLLAIGVLLLFLRHLRSTLTIALSIPLSIVATFVLMNHFGVSLNIMSLGGLALGIGMLVDNSIVVLESIGRRREAGDSPEEAAFAGASAVGKAVIAATLTTIAVFLPIIFVEGVAGQIFGDLALTVTASLLVSLLVAVTVIPMIAGFRRGDGLGEAAERRLAAAGRGAAPGSEAPGSAAPRCAAPGCEAAASEAPGSDAALSTEADAPGARRRGAALWRAVTWPVRLPVRGGGWIAHLVWRAVRWVAGLAAPALGRPARGLARVGRGILRGLRASVRWPLGFAGRRLEAVGDRFDTGFRWLAGRYVSVLELGLARPWRVIVGAGLLLLVTGLMGSRLGVELIPTLAQGEFTFDLELPEGTPLEVTSLAVERIEEELAAVPGLDVYFARVGKVEQSGGVAERSESRAQIGVVMRDRGDRQVEARTIERIREILASRPAIEATFNRPSYFSFKKPIEVQVVGYDLRELAQVAARVELALAGVGGIKDVESSLEAGSPEVQIRFDRQRLASMGIDLAAASRVLRNQVHGEVVTHFKERDRRIDVRVRELGSQAIELDEVGGLVVSQVGGVPVMLASVADVAIDRGPAQVERVDQQRVAILSANLSGRDLGTVSRDIMSELRAVPLPPHMAVSLGGQNEELERSFSSLLLAMLLAVILVYMVLASQFESLLHPFVILFAVPLGLVGAIWGLWLTGTAISVVVLVGVIMLAGIVVNNAIVLVDYVNQCRQAGLAKVEAIVEGGRVRLRPILMTTATTVLGLLPMALAIGEGAEVRAPMAVAVIGGLLASTLLTLIVIPCLYAVLDRGE